MRQPFRRASLYVNLLLVTEAVIGLLILAATAYYHALFTGYLSEIECRLVSGYLSAIYVFGAQLLVTFLCSIAMWRRIWRRRCTPNVRLLLSMWGFYSCVIIASGFVCIWSLYRGIDVLENAAESSLSRGIDMYYSCPEWKLLWDGLQWRKECCGVHGYRDWMTADWMPRLEDNCSSTVLAPYACCRRSCDSCSTNFLPGEGQSIGGDTRQPFPALTVDAIHANGCLPAFVDAVWSLFYVLLALWVLALKFLIVLCCMAKFILHRQNDDCDNVALTDEEGHPLVVVKYPCNVRCVAIGEDDLGSDIALDVNYCNCTELDNEQCGH
ncbi:tetraspanin-15 isoform X1 [Drosophila elegans]|uniref:tetraspanin-15 isoform X1 n=1 Tax=Drosophila elegans TaxID=30023 RepID=UPI0007E84B1F|nr:tetraspanin-15 isoform X1 [Drosophila elegans]